MGTPRKRKTKAEKEAEKNKRMERWNNMSADEFEKQMNDPAGQIGIYGYSGSGGMFDKDSAAEFLKNKRAEEAKAATQGHVGDMVKQYTGQDLPPPPGSAGGPKGQQQGGGSPKGQPQQPQVDTGATPGSYMDRMRQQRGAAGTPGFEAFAPPPRSEQPEQPMGGSPKGQGGGSPKGQQPRMSQQQPPSRFSQPAPRPNPYANAFRPPPRQRAPRRYNPLTGMME